VIDWNDIVQRRKLHTQHTSRELAEMFNVSKTAVCAALARRGVTAKRPRHPRELDIDWIKARRMARYHSHEYIAKQLGCSRSLVTRRLRR